MAKAIPTMTMQTSINLYPHPPTLFPNEVSKWDSDDEDDDDGGSGRKFSLGGIRRKRGDTITRKRREPAQRATSGGRERGPERTFAEHLWACICLG
jgi:hypothetical protein